MPGALVDTPINVRSREREPPMLANPCDPTTLQRAGIIGNGTLSAVINHLGRYVWLCPGHSSGDPIFNSLLNNESKECGFMDVVLTGLSHAHQEYVRNTAVLRTRLFSEMGDIIEITDFCPRFSIYERMHSPFQAIRILRRLAGDPHIAVRVRPTFMHNSMEGVNVRVEAAQTHDARPDAWQPSYSVLWAKELVARDDHCVGRQGPARGPVRPTATNFPGSGWRRIS